MRYEHKQAGYVTGLGLLLGAVIVYFSFHTAFGTLGWSGTLFTGGFVLGALLFSSLTVHVEEESLRFYFGPGFWERCIPLQDIQSVHVVRNSAWYGWGIRYTPHGWLYNVSGLQAVELQVRGEGTLRIGTDEPEALKRALERAMKVK